MNRKLAYSFLIGLMMVFVMGAQQPVRADSCCVDQVEGCIGSLVLVICNQETGCTRSCFFEICWYDYTVNDPPCDDNWVIYYSILKDCEELGMCGCERDWVNDSYSAYRKLCSELY